ncbi:sulfotransferase family protein [Neolewinella sp.]|uniref:sulfotransferase family protein n=1 Tax=Neolewinella sp. TaxID=2993543 RepID=UPI003B526BCE
MALEVIGLGLGRTGTLSLKLALEQLGFGKCYHMDTLLAQPRDIFHWKELHTAGHTDLDCLFKGYGAAVDFPTVAYHEPILRHYPRAKCILTVRDEASWYTSARATILDAEPSLGGKIRMSLKLPFSRRQRQLLEVAQLAGSFWQLDAEDEVVRRARAIQFFHDWNARIQATVPSERLLVFNVRQGWEPLCTFLGVPVPAAAFPRSNGRGEFARKYHRLLGA